MSVRSVFQADNEAVPVIDMNRMPTLKEKYHQLGGAKWLRRTIRNAEVPVSEERLLRALPLEEQKEMAKEMHYGMTAKRAAIKYKVSLKTAQYLLRKFRTVFTTGSN